ncbi:MAG: S41 family peptidase [Candidatus Bruticola sp.]
MCFSSFLLLSSLCVAGSQIGQTVSSVRTILLEQSIFYPEESKLNEGLKRGVKEVIPSLETSLTSVSFSAQNLDSTFASIQSKEPGLAGRAGEKAIERMVESIGDPYTALLTKADMEKDKLMAQSGRFAGIGVELAWRGGLVVVGTLPNSPAAAFLRSGDFIAAVDGQSVKNMTFYRAGDLLAGEAGSTVKLKIVRSGRTVEVNVVRAALSLPPVSGKVIEPGIGYLQIGYFSPTTAEEVSQNVKKLTASSADKLILDLRSNPGGDFKEGLRTAAIFAQGELLKVKRRSGLKRMKNSYPPSFKGKIAVLTDSGTASSAEVVTAALQGQPNVVVIGQKTFGKGLIQTLYPLPGGFGLRVSTGLFLNREGVAINKAGITPDLKSESALKDAVDYLRKK